MIANRQTKLRRIKELLQNPADIANIWQVYVGTQSPQEFFAGIKKDEAFEFTIGYLMGCWNLKESDAEIVAEFLMEEAGIK